MVELVAAVVELVRSLAAAVEMVRCFVYSIRNNGRIGLVHLRKLDLWHGLGANA